MSEGGPRRDKFASLQASQQAVSTPNHVEVDKERVQRVATVTGRRDKFASLMAAPKDSTEYASSPAVAQRDKFASLSQSSGQMHMKQGSASGSQVSASKLLVDETKSRLQSRINQRNSVLTDLEKAEGLTWNLIGLAEETASSLSALGSDQKDLYETAEKFRASLQQIHGLLSPHASLVMEYRNHQQEEDVSNMYAARVDMRLAQERRMVVEDLLELQRQHAREEK